MKVAIINYNVGNLASVYNACKLIDAQANIVSNPNELKNYTKVILPGVLTATQSAKTSTLSIETISHFLKLL